MNGDWEEPGASYIPERYRQQIAAKKQRRILIRVAAILGIIIVCAVAYIILTGPGPGVVPGQMGQSNLPPTPSVAVPPGSSSPTQVPSGSESAPPKPSTTSGTSGPVLSPALLAAQQEAGILRFDQAQAYLRDDFPASAFTLISADIRTLSPGKRVYSFTITPAGSTTPGGSSIVYIDAVNGDPYTPGQEKATVTLASAKNSISDDFPGLHPDRIRIRYSAPTGGQALWNFTLSGSNATLLTGSLDAVTGQMASFTRITPLTGRPANPAVDNTSAEKLAERYISDRNGPVSIALVSERHVLPGAASSPSAGSWVFEYSRVVQEYPCDADGFTIAIDSVTGEVTSYERRWNTPDYAFVIAPDPIVLKREATYTVLHKAQDTYPGLASGVTIISADIRWKDGHPADTVPRPSSIPLAWKVVFDDDLIRKMSTPVPAVAWVDVQSGSLISIDYRH